MNLVIALLSTHGYITAERIRASVAGYAESPTDEAFSRMFERDKNELRDLGIPLETGRVSTFDPAEGYRINRNAYALPDIELTAEEAAAVAVAAQLWESPELITATQGALLKLRAAGVDVDPDAAVAITTATGPPGLRGSEDVLGILLSAIDSGRAVQFAHRPNRSAPYVDRTLEPWGVVTYRGRWYVVGHDRDRDAPRTFRVSRIGDGVRAVGPDRAVTRPDGVNLRDIVHRAVAEWPAGEQARGLWIGTVVDAYHVAHRIGAHLVEAARAHPLRELARAGAVGLGEVGDGQLPRFLEARVAVHGQRLGPVPDLVAELGRGAELVGQADLGTRLLSTEDADEAAAAAADDD